MRDRRWILAGHAVALLLLTGCVDIPDHGEPQPVSGMTSAAGGPGPPVEVLAPKGGEQPDEIVRGFLAASASNVRTRPSARLFLTPDAARSWEDDASATVIAQDATRPDAAAGQVTLTGQILGRVDRDGVYNAVREDLRQVLSLVQVDGEWRIDNPPPGVLLRVDDFRRAYVSYNLYFLDPTGTTVVPDPRYFLSGSTARANSLVEELIEGPSPFLAPAVRTELSGDVALVSNVQEVRDIDIDLTGLGERSPASLQGLSAQLIWTLRQVSITELTLRSDGQILSVPGVGVTQTGSDWQSYDPNAVPVDDIGHFVSQGALLTVEGQPVPGPAGEGAYGLTSVGVSSGLDFVAGVAPAPGGSSLLIGEYGGALGPVLAGRSFSSPVWVARQQEVWTVRNGTEVVRVPVGAAPQTVDTADLLGLGPIRALRVARDGTRVAIVAGEPGAGELYLGHVARSGSTVAVAGFVPLFTGLGNVSDVSWATATQLLFLAVDPADGRTKPWVISIDGGVLASQPDNNLSGVPTAIAAAPGRPALVSSDGAMYRLDGTAWTTLVRGLPFFTGTAPSYPG